MPRVSDLLSDENKKKLYKAKGHLKKRFKKNKKPPSEEKVNWVEIMGMNRPTYKRGKGGAWRGQ